MRGTANGIRRSNSRLMNCRARPGSAYVPTDVEHIANMVTHGIWILPSFAAGVWMVNLAHTPLQYLTSVIYGMALMALFITSTTFHTISYTGKCMSWKNVFHIGDRAVIYIFIAASYTPWLTLKDMQTWGMQTLWLVWLAAVLGIVYQYTFHEKYKWLETILYVVLGACPAVSVVAMKNVSGLTEMAFGGMVYIIGVFFFKCDGVLPFAHAIWHCFVFVGAAFHYYAVCKYLLGPHNVEAS
ncbi:monocyte to macrophage differentiation factor 2 isoform X2 [Lingula anatina]|uniref:Monocyte to macrophage differentiation factor 2 isoform X2 n=1 Tax=Lingula anatina TaxID=7574 RepID=A0A1S3J2T6_LINAN|nr:monocyte to macrophage differentiation factor 2 isoform X2 [Lingula anatina]|eukprot:XP_013404591.1 monocyte to macrophage differentiation factor 2 isoform X2 [Lingula anatina]